MSKNINVAHDVTNQSNKLSIELEQNRNRKYVHTCIQKKNLTNKNKNGLPMN